MRSVHIGKGQQWIAGERVHCRDGIGPAGSDFQEARMPPEARQRAALQSLLEKG
jgi:hypothetical protein